MRKAIHIAAVAASSAILSTALPGAASAADATASAGGRIIAALALTKTEDLYFGTIVPSAQFSDTVSITAAGTLTCGSALTCLGNDTTPAGFSVTGEGGFGYTVTLPNSVQISNGETAMIVNALVASNGSQGTISQQGTDNFTVGGTLNVGAAQAIGTYSGTFNVTVEYN